MTTQKYTKKELKATTHPIKPGYIGPCYWLYYKGYGTDMQESGSIQMYEKQKAIALFTRGTKAVGPVYIKRPQ